MTSSRLLDIKVKTIFIFLLSHSSVASNCYQVSSQFSDLKDDYYDLGKSKQLTSENKKSITDFYKQISGRWMGEFFVLECEGTETDPIAIAKKGKVIAEIREESEGILILEADIDYNRDNLSSSRKIKTLGWDSLFTIDHNNKEKLVFTEKYRKGSFRGDAPIVEHFFQFTTINEDSLEIIQTIYYGGQHVIEERWSLKK